MLSHVIATQVPSWRIARALSISCRYPPLVSTPAGPSFAPAMRPTLSLSTNGSVRTPNLKPCYGWVRGGDLLLHNTASLQLPQLPSLG